MVGSSSREAGLRGRSRVAVGSALVLSGFAALGLQVVWQRIVSLHVGAAASATALVIAGFLGGLGIGSVLGGRMADRLGLRSVLGALALAEAAVAVFAATSPWYLYDLFLRGFPGIGGTPAGNTLTVVLLLVPTTTMGLTLPLAARAVATRLDHVGSDIGWLYALNTIGGAVGALVIGWRIVGSVGYTGATRLCAVVALTAALVFLVLRSVTLREPARGSELSRNPDSPVATRGRWGVGTWYLLYALSGALAIGLQQTFFRVVSAVNRSNSYTFATVLALYLATFAGGSAAGSAVVGRTADPGRVFVWLQVGVGSIALGSTAVLTKLLPLTGLGDDLDSWFNSDGFASGYDFGDVRTFVLFGLLLPALVVCPAVFLMGAGFPFLEREVTHTLHVVGRRTGGLIAANTFGNVAGALFSVFVLLRILGTAGTQKAIAAVLIFGGLGALWLRSRKRLQLARMAVAAVAGIAMLVVVPGNHELWLFFAGKAESPEVLVFEDASCASVLEPSGAAGFSLRINGATQNGYPYDDFHVLIGLLPSLMNPEKPTSLAIGFGIGSTSFALLADSEARSVTSVELCGGNYAVAAALANRGRAEFVALLGDSRHEQVTDDGRNYLLRSGGDWDAIVVDTLRPTSSSSGQHFSVDFYDLVAKSLGDTGVFAQWVPTWRAQNSAARVFPYLVTATVGEYNDSVLMIGSRAPINVEPAELVSRFDVRASASFQPAQRRRLRSFLAAWHPECVTAGATVEHIPERLENRDLAPRDELHLNNGFIGESETFSTC